jgi:SAM-dependent methyltransferase
VSDFEDHFSRVAGVYARHRPGYPGELFEYLASVAPARDLAWDCATGSGQAALSLAEHFARVVATDASAEQLAHAFAHPRVEYRREPAEGTDLPDRAVDLVTVAVAAHWFDLERFYAEVRRVSRPGAVLAIWGYFGTVIAPELDRLITRLSLGMLGDSWPAQVHYVRDGYRTLPFPFEELAHPAFENRADWDLDQMAGFIESWSASRLYLERHGRHALEEIWPDFRRAWGRPGERRAIRWPLHLRVGRVGAPLAGR